MNRSWMAVLVAGVGALLTIASLLWLGVLTSPLSGDRASEGAAPSGKATSGRSASEAWADVRWSMLIPKDWDPSLPFQGIDWAKLSDADPRAQAALQALRERWDAAPADPAHDGRKVRIAGFALPLEHANGGATEFLVVPYFGACIHTPPPPANQIIHARSDLPQPGVSMMAPLWVYGTLTVQRSQSEWGVAGYGMVVDKVEPYRDTGVTSLYD